jgi:SulP family sulfate permease
MRPRVAVLGMHPDGTLRDVEYFQLSALHPKLGAIRFDGSLVFVNVAYFEEAILKLERQNPALECILVVGSGINGLDASGVEMLSNLAERLRTNGITLAFSGLKRQVLQVMEHTELLQKIGGQNVFHADPLALDTLRARLDSKQAAP